MIVIITIEDGLAVIATRDDVVEAALDLNSQLAGHNSDSVVRSSLRQAESQNRELQA